MNMLLVLKILVIAVAALMFLLAANKTGKSVGGLRAFVYIIVEAVIFFIIGYGAQWAVSQSFIKVELRRFHNTPLPSSEKLALKGCVKNVGGYKATVVTLHVKIINNASGGSFAGSGDPRPSTREINTVVARNLAKGTTKCFNKRFKYPTYFKLANIKAHISAK